MGINIDEEFIQRSFSKDEIEEIDAKGYKVAFYCLDENKWEERIFLNKRMSVHCYAVRKFLDGEDCPTTKWDCCDTNWFPKAEPKLRIIKPLELMAWAFRKNYIVCDNFPIGSIKYNASLSGVRKDMRKVFCIDPNQPEVKIQLPKVNVETGEIIETQQ